MHCFESTDGNAASARPSRTQYFPCLLEPTRVEACFQQCELDQIVLRAAAANALILSSERPQNCNRLSKVAMLECSKSTRQCRQVGTRRVTPLARQSTHLLGACLKTCLVSHHRLCQENMKIG